MSDDIVRRSSSAGSAARVAPAPAVGVRKSQSSGSRRGSGRVGRRSVDSTTRHRQAAYAANDVGIHGRHGMHVSSDSKKEIAGGDALTPLRPVHSYKKRPSLRVSGAVGTPPHSLTPGSGSGMRFTFEDGTPVGSMRHMPTMGEHGGPISHRTNASAGSLGSGGGSARVHVGAVGGAVDGSGGGGNGDGSSDESGRDQITPLQTTASGKFARAAHLAVRLSRGSSLMASTKNLLQAGSKMLSRKPKAQKQQIKTATQILSEKMEYLKSTSEIEGSMRSWRSSRERRRDKVQVPCFILRPQSPVRLTWDLMTLFLLLYVAVATPFQIGFGEEAVGFWAILETIVDVFFIVDLFLNFRTGYISANGEEVLSGCKIAKAYLTGWFWIDMLSSIPYQWIMGGFGDLRSAKMLKAGRVVKALRVVRLTKLVRFLKLAVFIEKLEENFSINRNLLQLVKLLLGTVVMCHFFACMWFFFGTLEDTPFGWVYDHNMQDETAGTRYLTSFYWAVATLATVGYGDVVPITNTERTFAIIGMLLGGGYFGYIIATMASLVSKLDASTAAYHNKMDAIVSYMKSRNLPRDLQMRIRKYYKHYLEKKTAFDESRMLSELSTFLRQEVAMFLINDTLFKIPIFRGRDPTFVADLITVLKPLTCSEGDYIMREGEFGREMFVLIRGELEVLHDGHPLALLGPGSYFGEMSVLYPEHYERQATIRAVTYCEMYSLARDDLLFVCRDHQSVLDEMRKIAMDTYEELKRQRELVSRDDTNQIDASLLLHADHTSPRSGFDETSSDEEVDERDLSRGQSMYDMPSSTRSRRSSRKGSRRGNSRQVAPASSYVESKAHPGTKTSAVAAAGPPPMLVTPVTRTGSHAQVDIAAQGGFMRPEASITSPVLSSGASAHGSLRASPPPTSPLTTFGTCAYTVRKGLSALESAVERLSNSPDARVGLPRTATNGQGLLLLPTAVAASQRGRASRSNSMASARSGSGHGLPMNYSNLSVSADDVPTSNPITSSRNLPPGATISTRSSHSAARSPTASRRRRRSIASPERAHSTASAVDRQRALIAAQYETLRSQVAALGKVIRTL